jgi:hypothetical protein
MTDTNGMKQTFATLASGAQSGQLLIEDGVAKKCADSCNTYVKKLQDMARDLRFMIHVSSYGDLGSAQKFANKFDSLTQDTTPGSGSFAAALVDHISVVQNMADMFTKAGQAYTNSDAETKAKIQQTMKNLDVSK